MTTEQTIPQPQVPQIPPYKKDWRMEAFPAGVQLGILGSQALTAPASLPTPTGEFAGPVDKWQYETYAWQKLTEEARAEEMSQPLSGQSIAKYIFRHMLLAPFGGAAFPPPVQKPPDQVTFADIEPFVIAGISRSNFMQTFYNLIPTDMSAAGIDSVESWFKLMGMDRPDYLRPSDLAEMEQVIARLKIGRAPGSPDSSYSEVDDGPGFLALEAEDIQEQAQVEEFLTGKIRITPQPMHRISVEEVIEHLTASSATGAIPSLPEGMSAEEILETLKYMDIPADILAEATEYFELTQPLRDSALTQAERIAEVLAGLAEWEMPQLSLTDRLKFFALSPFQVVSDVIRPYLTEVAYPLSGIATHLVSRFLPGTQDIEKQLALARKEGEDPWHAFGTAWEETSMNMWAKLAIEIAVDPLTWIPGVGLSIPGKLLTRAGFRTAGTALLATNEAWWKASDIPFNWLKSQWQRIPKTFEQKVPIQLAAFSETWGIAMHQYTNGKSLQFWTAEDMIGMLDAARAAFRAVPEAADNPLVQMGAHLHAIPPASSKQILEWSAQAGGRLTEVNFSLLDDVNQQLIFAAAKSKPIEQIAKELALHMMIADTPENLQKLARQITRYVDKFSTRVDKVIKIGQTAEIRPLQRMIRALRGQQEDIISKTLKSEYIKGREIHGVLQKLTDGMDAVERNKYRLVLDRWFVRPLASSYLGTPSYAIWNAFESIFVSIFEGVTPKIATREEFVSMMAGVKGVDSALVNWMQRGTMAGDPSGMKTHHMLGGWSPMPGRIPNSIAGVKLPSFIAGKDYLEWTARRWVDLSDEWGTGFRANFLMRKMRQYLSEHSHNVAGVDVNAIARRLIEPGPRFSKRYHNITKKSLRAMMWARFTTGDVRVVRELKDLVNNGYMLIGEQLKLLRQVSEFSPAARELGAETIQRGEVLKSEQSIVSFVDDMAQRTLNDMAVGYKTAQESFQYMADGLTTRTVRDSGDLMETFRNYEVMYEVAGNIPHKTLSDVWPKVQELRRAKKWGEIRDTWTEARASLQATMDSIWASMDSVRSHILNNSQMLGKEERQALETIMDKSQARETIWAKTFDEDRRFLDDWWKLGKGQREGQYDSFWDMRAEIWENYRREVAVIGGDEFQMRRNYGRLYQNLPPPKLVPVNMLTRSASIQDIAHIMGCNVDAVCTGVAENMALQDKHMFVQMILKQAEAYPEVFKGVTEQKLYRVYDQILASMQFNRVDDIAKQKVLMQAEGLKNELITLRMNGAMSTADKVGFDSWVDRVASGMDDMFREGGVITKQAWDDLRQKASEYAHKEYYKAFADYTNQNIIDAAGKQIFPFWTYHLYRWQWLARTGVRHPGTATAWGKYYEYSDYGYVRIPGTDIEINPFVGSVFGTTFGLARRDFKSYYENLPLGIGVMLDAIQRRGFFPGPHVMLPIVLSPIFSGKPPELGELLPPISRMGLNALVQSPIPQVKKGSQWLLDRVFHENFRDYYVTTIIDQYQAQAGGELIDGQTGAQLWHKRQRGEAFTEEEAELWQRASDKTGYYYILRSQVPANRFRPEEMEEAYLIIGQIIEAQLGITLKQQDYLWRHNIRPTDMIGGLPLDIQLAMDEIWQWKIWFGRGQVLMPPNIQDLYNKIDKYWSRVRLYQDERTTAQAEKDTGFLNPTETLHFSGREWRSQYAQNWGVYVNKVEGLEQDPEFVDALDALTPEGQVRLAQELGYSTPVRHPLEEAIDLYYSIELKERRDPYTGQDEWDYLGFWLNRDAVRSALTEEQRADFDATVKKNETPLERVFRWVTETYLRGYRSVPRVVFDMYPGDLQPLIKEYYMDGTTLERQEEIKEYKAPDGRKLISAYESDLTEARRRLRVSSPELDFWLYVWGYTKPLTPSARSMTDEFDKDRSMILRM